MVLIKTHFRPAYKRLNQRINQACKKSREVFLPNGMFNSIPEEWGCSYSDIKRKKYFHFN